MASRRSDDRAAWRGRPNTACALVLLMALTAGGVAGVTLKAPAGAAGGQAVVLEEQPLSLSCEGTAPLRLAYPLFLGSLPEVKQLRTTVNGADHWNATVYVARALRQHTGLYNCSADSDPPPASVYIYVRSADGQYPWVKDYHDIEREEMIGLYSAPMQGTATLDCRPNNPDTQVHLVDSTGKQMKVGRQPDGSDLTWDPRIGFRISPVGTQHSGTYKCVVDEHRPELKLKLQAVATSVIPPWVRTDLSKPYALAGSDLTITCELAMIRRLNFSLSWRGPDGQSPLNEGSRWEYFGNANERNAWHRRDRTINLFRVSQRDAGEYTCTAQDEQGNSRSTVFQLEVRDSGIGGNSNQTESPVKNNKHPSQHHTSSSGNTNYIDNCFKVMLSFIFAVVLSK